MDREEDVRNSTDFGMLGHPRGEAAATEVISFAAFMSRRAVRLASLEADRLDAEESVQAILPMTLDNWVHPSSTRSRDESGKRGKNG